MDAGDAMERGQRSPRLPESRSPKILDDSLTVPLIQNKKTGSKAPAVVLGFECLESTAFNGVGTNLVLYLESVLHGSNLGSASNVTSWMGTSYLTPVFGAIVADTFWGNYNTILVSLVIYLLGMMLVTLSAFLPVTELCGVGSSCHPLLGAKNVAFIGLYLVAFGSGGVRAALLPFGAEQFDDANAVDRERKMSFFSWFYICVDFGMIVSGVFIVWVQQNVSWGLGFGIATACIALAFACFVLATPMYKRTTPTGTPLKSLAQVVVAAGRNARLRAPADAAFLHEVAGDKVDHDQPRIAHTDEFAFLDKAAVIAESDDLEDVTKDASVSSWRLCTVTQVEELKILLRLMPIWATSIVLSAAYAQLNTTFVQQGGAMDMRVTSWLTIPAASMVSFEVLCVLAWVLIYGCAIVPALRAISPTHGEPSQLRRMGAGRLLMACAMAAAAAVEAMRLGAAARGELLSIAWQMPQYFVLAGAEVFCYIAQLEFFYTEAPEAMKSICTSLALLTVALGSYMSSLIYAVVDALTARGGRAGWIADDLDEGHLDYFFWTMAALCTLNFVVYSAFARNYKVKTVVS
ncbi:unnamed protein product [Urochloa decumbens]|uniref:Uncharacterized protein n=1 Tax=Urochloa decumbens TaxID=240449 RepID=A0ABC9CTB1_9POAL